MQHRATHREALLDKVGIFDDGSTTAERDFRTIVAYVKDHGSAEFWPVYERDGWHTTRPSEEVRQRAEWEAVRRALTEHMRLFGMLSRFRSHTPLYGSVSLLVAFLREFVRKLEADLPDPDRQGDHCLMHIDRLKASGRLYG